MEEVIAALDIGSTRTSYAAGTSDGELLTQIYSEDTNAESLSRQISEKVRDLEEELGESINIVSIASTGLIDRENKLIKRFDLKDGGYIENIDISEELGDRTLYLENDANTGALGEYYFGNGKEHNHMLRVTIGTGIGAGIVENGELLEGFRQNAGEIGHIIVDKDGKLSQEGVPGSWEAYCAGRGIPEFAEELHSIDVKDAEDLFEKAKKNSNAENILENIHQLNAKALGTATNVLAPESIVVAGTVATENPEIIDNIKQRIGKYCYVDKPEIRETELEEAEIYGALTLPRRSEG